ncbi:MAG: DNA-binding transcriptional regulator Fis [Ectothiorhodospiraceae bacterium]|jgi:Fis family transcriptional regulator
MEKHATQPIDNNEQGGGPARGQRGVGPIRAHVRDALDAYFRQLNGYDGAGLYKMVMTEVEIPLLEVVMRECGGNQTKAAEVLGINRGTLRKKLQHYGLEL